jgi:hypothetical protein
VKLLTRNAALHTIVLLLLFAVALWYMVGRPGRGTAIMTPPTISVDALRAHIQTLAGDIGERNVFRPGTLALAADYIEGEWRKQGYEVTHQNRDNASQNLEVTSAGTREIIVIGAHV